MRKLAAIIALTLALAGCASTPQVEAKDVWIKSSEMSQIGGMTGLFGTITNNSSKDIVFIGGETDAAGIVEVHEMAMIEGEMKMQEIDGGIVIPAGQSIVLEPGGNHLMLMALNADILAGDKINVTLKFDGADDLVLTGVMAKPAEGGDEDYHSGEMDN